LPWDATGGKTPKKSDKARLIARARPPKVQEARRWPSLAPGAENPQLWLF